MCKIDEIFKAASDLGQPFCSVTDHGSTSGLWEAQKAGEKYGVKPILGCEFYYERENDEKNGHLIVLAKNNVGLENIFKLQEFSYVDNFYRKPRINFETLIKHKEGLIVSSACLASTFSQYIMNDDISSAIDWARKFQNEFGEDFLIEIQPNSIPEQLIVNKASIMIAEQLGIDYIATNDVHYVFENDSFPHEVLLALQTNSKMSDEKRWFFPTVDFWLKSKEEMASTFIGIPPEKVAISLQNTLKVAERCSAQILKGKYLPTFYNVPQGSTEREELIKKVKDGISSLGFTKNKEFIAEVQNEIDVVDRNGYSGYFLIVEDYVNTARQSGIIVGDGRGSGAGSKIAYLTGITKIPPHKFDLLFERFMADGRSPDFDVDFSDQDAVFSDLQNKYGIENVARIIAFGTLTPKAVVRKILSCFEHPMSEIGRITKLIDEAKTLQDAYSTSAELCQIRNKYKTEFDVAERLEGVISHESQHAGGVIIYPQLSKFLPLKTRGEDRTKRIVAFDKYMLEELGHYKFDILGLETLPVIKRSIDSIKQSSGIDLDLYSIDYDDEKVYSMLCKGEVSGVFQLANQSAKVMQQQPLNFKDLIAINALIRPGVGDWDEYIARRKGKVWNTPAFHPARLPYLEETVGLIAYQEQYLLDAKVLAGWDVAYADQNIRKNKNITCDLELKEKFIFDVMNNKSLSPSFTIHGAVCLWEEICDAVSKGYSFNKSHAASYAMISYQTAYLKCYYPEHFYASLMSSEKTDGDGQSAIAGYIQECKQNGINILPPDINLSDDSFVVTPQGIAYRITTIKHVGESAIEGIRSLRPITSFSDFMERREKSSVRQNVLVNLIKAGCFDCFGSNRAELLWQVDMENRTKTQIKENYICQKYDWNDKVKAEWEKEVLGMYLSTHPLEKYGFNPLSSFPDGSNALQGGEVYEVKTFNDKNGNEMAFVFLDTLFGNVKVLVFSSAWKDKKLKELLSIGNVLLVKGRKSGDAVLLEGCELLER